MRNNWFSQKGLTAALPPNVEAGRMAGIIRSTLLGAVFGGGILFACRYGSAYQSLMEWDPVRNRSVVREGARMLPFWQTMEPALVLMALFALGALLSATVLYASYYQGGRSIYLMRRLPDGGRTLRRQVWTVPLRWMVACIVAAAVLGAALWVQIVLFFVVSIAALAATRPLVQKMLHRDETPTNADRVLGQTARVTETIDNTVPTGAVYADGKTWTARSASGRVIPKDTLVKVQRMEGVRLFVEGEAGQPVHS